MSRLEAAAAKIEQVRALAAARGRKVRFGIRLHTISRDTSAAAWAVADELLAELTDEQIAKATELHAKSESEGQRRMTALHGGRIDQLEIYPNLWAGVGLVRGGAGTALVGSHEEVANLIYEYHSLGFDEFILSGYPHLEEAYWFAEGVLPLLRQKGVACSDIHAQQLNFSPISGGGATFCRHPNGTTPASLNRAADWWA